MGEFILEIDQPVTAKSSICSNKNVREHVEGGVKNTRKTPNNHNEHYQALCYPAWGLFHLKGRDTTMKIIGNIREVLNLQRVLDFYFLFLYGG